MKANDIVQLVLYFGLLIGLAPVLGGFMGRVFQGQGTFLSGLLGPIERWVYRLGGVDTTEEMSWKRYFLAALTFNVIGIVTLMALEMTQAWLPLNPQKFPNVPWALALNTAISFITNTNWQAYSGENTMSYLTQMAGLAVHNFLSAATGIAILVAFARGLRRATSKSLGNFWVDLTRATLYVLLPFSMIVTIVLVSQGVVQNFKPYTDAKLVESYTTQVPKTDDKGQPVNGPDGKPVGKTGSSRFVYLVAPVKDASGAAAQLVIGGLTEDPADAPGPYGVYLPSTTHKMQRTTATDGGVILDSQDWVFAAATGERLELHIKYERGVGNKNNLTDVKFYSAKTPAYYQISREERVTDVLRNVTTSPRDRVKEFSFVAAGGSYGKLFDGSQKSLSWDNITWINRAVLVP
jgi:hypothetical protein